MANGPEQDDVKRAVAIDQRNIQAEYCSLPSALSLWIFRRVEATKRHRLAELELEVLEENTKIDTRAANQQAVRESIHDEKGKPTIKGATVDEIDALVATNPMVVKAKREVIDAAEKKERCAGMVEALIAKRDMLIQCGSDIRAEKKGDPSIRDHQVGGDNRPRKQWTGRR
jgi:hypothetical protein